MKWSTTNKQIVYGEDKELQLLISKEMKQVLEYEKKRNNIKLGYKVISIQLAI